MALYKEVIQKNGIVTNYHRILYLSITTNEQNYDYVTDVNYVYTLDNIIGKKQLQRSFANKDEEFIDVETVETLFKNLLDIKQKLKVKNDDIYFLKNLAEQLRNSNKYCLNDNQLSTLLDILKRNF